MGWLRLAGLWCASIDEFMDRYDVYELLRWLFILVFFAIIAYLFISMPVIAVFGPEALGPNSF